MSQNGVEQEQQQHNANASSDAAAESHKLIEEQNTHNANGKTQDAGDNSEDHAKDKDSIPNHQEQQQHPSANDHHNTNNNSSSKQQIHQESKRHLSSSQHLEQSQVGTNSQSSVQQKQQESMISEAKQGRGSDNTNAYSAYFANSALSPKKKPFRLAHSQSHGSGTVFQAKQNHKETSVKLKVLTNRINKLALEDKMIAEKAEDTETKANFIFEIKRREQIKKEESRRKMIEVDEVKFTHPIGQLEKRKIQLSRQFIMDRNKEEALALKRERDMLFQEKALFEEKNMENLKMKVDQIKREKQLGNKNRSDFFSQRTEDVQAEQLRVLENERKQQQRKEELMKQLEQKEQEQLAKLNSTKQRNQNAQEQLAFSKNQQTKEYESRFGIPVKNKQTKTINGLPASRFQNQAVTYVLAEDKQGLTVLKTSAD